MSKSRSRFKRSALAGSYALLFGEKCKIDEGIVRSRSASVATVEAKLKAAENCDAGIVEDTGPAQRTDVMAGHGKQENGHVNQEIVQGNQGTVPEIQRTGQENQTLAAAASTDVHEGESPAPGEALGQEDIKVDKQARLKMAESLTNSENMWTEFFSGMLDDCMDVVEENLDESELELVSEIEKDHGRQRMEHRASLVCCLPIKLILTPLRRANALVKAFASHLEMQFGPLHAALQVGQVILEWNDSHLVTPYRCAYEDRLIQVSLEKHSRWVDCVELHKGHLTKATEDLDHSGQTEQVFLIAAKKKEMIDELIKVIVRYNTSYYYNVIDRNCQDFVMDALKALKVELPREFTGGLREYYKAIIKGRNPKVPREFKTHRDLDKYVKEQDLPTMSQHDLEFILALYFRFHLKSKEKLRDNKKLLEEWVCEEESCQMEDVEDRVDYHDLLIHQFKPI